MVSVFPYVQGYPNDVAFWTGVYSQVVGEQHTGISVGSPTITLAQYPFVERSPIIINNATGLSLTVLDDYTESGDQGKITFLGASPPASVTITYWYWSPEILNTPIYNILLGASIEAQYMTGKDVTDIDFPFPNPIIEYYDFFQKKRIGFGATGLEGASRGVASTSFDAGSYALYTEAEPEYDPDILVLDKRPIITVDSVALLDRDGNVVKNLNVGSDVIIKSDAGVLIFRRDTITTGYNIVRVNYVSGLVEDNLVVPLIKKITTLIAAKSLLTGLMGKDDKLFDSYSLGALSVTKGDVTAKFAAQIGIIQAELDRLLKLAGPNLLMEVV